MTGDNSKPFLATVRISASLWQIPPPVPPIVKAGRTITGYPHWCANSTASSTVLTVCEAGTGSPSSFINSLNFSRSSASSIESSLVPRSSIPNSSRRPVLDKETAKLRPICPPRVGKIASGYSCRIIRERESTVNGSM